MWAGVFPAVTTKFTEDDRLDHAEMERCFSLQIEAGCDGLIVCGSLGEGPMLSLDEKLAVLKTAQGVAKRQAGAADRQRGRDPRGRGAGQARRSGRRRRADGGAEPDLPHQPGRDRGDAEGGRGGRRAAGHDLLQPHRLPRRRDGRDHGGAGRRPAVRGDQGILRRHPPLDRDHQRASATASICSPASTTSPSRRWRSVRSAGSPGWSTPSRARRWRSTS